MQLINKVMIPNHILQTEKLDAIEKVLYLYLYATSEQPQVTYSKLMSVTGIASNATMSKYLKKLQMKNLLTIEKNQAANGFNMANTYRLNKQATYFLDVQETQAIVAKMQTLMIEFACQLTPQQLETLVQAAQIRYGEKACRELVMLFVCLEPQAYPMAFVQLSAQLAHEDYTQTNHRKTDWRAKEKLIMRLIALGMFGEVENPASYVQKIFRDPDYVDANVFELFEMLTGEHHLHAFEFDSLVFDIMYPPRDE